jgi:protocatechuate 3,4-dioxygenase beta subunit
MAGIQFLTQTGQISTDVRQEFILLSDIFGLSLLVDNIDHPKPEGATEGTVLGPFHTSDAEEMKAGDELSHDEKGEPLLCMCSVQNREGKGIPGVKIDVWETDSEGFYDVQRAGRTEPDGRGVLRSDEEGKFWFKAVVPVEYPIPHDGPVGKLLKMLGRHPYRPAHMHFMFAREGFDNLITALYVKGDRYESSDAVFGVKQSLVVEIGTVGEKEVKEYGVDEGTRLLKWEFVLVSEEETKVLRDKLAKEAMEELHLRNMKIVDGLPVPAVD